ELGRPVGGRARLQPQGVRRAADVDRVPVRLAGRHEVEAGHQAALERRAGRVVDRTVAVDPAGRRLARAGRVEERGERRVPHGDIEQQVAPRRVVVEQVCDIDDDVERVGCAGARARQVQQAVEDRDHPGAHVVGEYGRGGGSGRGRVTEVDL